MGPIEKAVMFGTKQEAILMPNEGYEIESVVVLNKTTNEVVPSQLTKTGDNPAKWICSFMQPAGVVVIKPRMKPIYYAVIIEACEHCDIVLLESNDVVNIQIANVHGPDIPDGDATKAEPNTEQEAGGPLHPEEVAAVEAGTSSAPVGPAEFTGAHGEGTPDALNGGITEENENHCSVPQSGGHEHSAEGQDASVNFKCPQHSSDIASGDDEGSNVEDDLVKPESEPETHEELQPEPHPAPCLQPESEVEPEPEEASLPEPEVESVPELMPEPEGKIKVEDEEKNIEDCVYPAGEFEADLQDVEPVKIYPAEYDRRCALYWKYKNARRAGEITQEEFKQVEEKHMKFMDDISNNRIVVVE